MTKQLLYVVKIAMIFAACLAGIGSYAQTRAISGKVIDAAGVPIVGASVIVVGNDRINTVTDLDGKFVLQVPAQANLNVTFIGYKSQVIAIGNQSVFEITLIEDTAILEEVVVVGYGVHIASKVKQLRLHYKTGGHPVAAARKNQSSKWHSRSASGCSLMKSRRRNAISVMYSPSRQQVSWFSDSAVTSIPVALATNAP